MNTVPPRGGRRHGSATQGRFHNQGPAGRWTVEGIGLHIIKSDSRMTHHAVLRSGYPERIALCGMDGWRSWRV